MNYTAANTTTYSNVIFSTKSSVEIFISQATLSNSTKVEFTSIFNQISSYSFYFVIAILVSIVGIFGNLMVMLSIVTSKELRKNSTCILCFNIALSDFLMSIFVNGFGKIGKYKSSFSYHRIF